MNGSYSGAVLPAILNLGVSGIGVDDPATAGEQGGSHAVGPDRRTGAMDRSVLRIASIGRGPDLDTPTRLASPPAKRRAQDVDPLAVPGQAQGVHGALGCAASRLHEDAGDSRLGRERVGADELDVAGGAEEDVLPRVGNERAVGIPKLGVQERHVLAVRGERPPALVEPQFETLRGSGGADRVPGRFALADVADRLQRSRLENVSAET